MTMGGSDVSRMPLIRGARGCRRNFDVCIQCIRFKSLRINCELPKIFKIQS
jgi:hypothetical protein